MTTYDAAGADDEGRTSSIATRRPGRLREARARKRALCGVHLYCIDNSLDKKCESAASVANACVRDFASKQAMELKAIERWLPSFREGARPSRLTPQKARRRCGACGVRSSEEDAWKEDDTPEAGGGGGSGSGAMGSGSGSGSGREDAANRVLRCPLCCCLWSLADGRRTPVLCFLKLDSPREVDL